MVFHWTSDKLKERHRITTWRSVKESCFATNLEKNRVHVHAAFSRTSLLRISLQTSHQLFYTRYQIFLWLKVGKWYW